MEILAPEILQLPKRKIKSIIGDPEKSAEAVNLIYVSDAQPGIKRIKKGKHFQYLVNESKKLIAKAELNRIKSLVIPPAWEDVWICNLANGHLQATGIDVKKKSSIDIIRCGIRSVTIQNIIACFSSEK